MKAIYRAGLGTWDSYQEFPFQNCLSLCLRRRGKERRSFILNTVLYFSVVQGSCWCSHLWEGVSCGPRLRTLPEGEMGMESSSHITQTFSARPSRAVPSSPIWYRSIKEGQDLTRCLCHQIFPNQDSLEVYVTSDHFLSEMIRQERIISCMKDRGSIKYLWLFWGAEGRG